MHPRILRQSLIAGRSSASIVDRHGRWRAAQPLNKAPTRSRLRTQASMEGGPLASPRSYDRHGEGGDREKTLERTGSEKVRRKPPPSP